eukprot:12422085-Karenia_brevis.AAC.1
MDKYSGDATQFRMWSFNLKVALGQVDSKLAEEVSKILAREDTSKFPIDWDLANDLLLYKVIYDKYKTELYGVLVSFTS